MKRSGIMLIIALLSAVFALPAAAAITFSGGSTSIEKTGGELAVSLSGGAKVEADDFMITADEIRIWGKDSQYVQCKGTASAVKVSEGITLMAPSLLLDRSSNSLRADSWVEIQDRSRQAALSCARLEYNAETGIMKLQIKARIVKQTSQGLLSCSADSITYDSKSQTLRLDGRASANWGESSYNASSISIDLETNEIKMEGKITGTVNG